MALVEDLIAKFLRPPHILLVEDDTDIGNIFINGLHQKYDAEVDWATDGDRAVDLLAKRAYDIVFLDLVLPRRSGVEVLKFIKASKPYLPVIVVSGAVGSKLWSEATSLGVVGVISKPFTMVNFEDVFRTYGIRALAKHEVQNYTTAQPLPA